MKTSNRPWTAPIVLPESAFVVLWERLGLGDLPRALFIPSPGATDEERAEVEHRATATLERVGIGAGGGLTGAAENALRLLAEPPAEYYGWLVPPGGDTIGLTAVTDGRRAVLAALADGFVHLVPVAAHDIAGALCRELPLEGPTAGEAFAVGADDPRLRDLLAPGRLGTRAQFFVSVAGRGRRLRSPHAIGYAETRQGNWFFHALGEGDRITAVPARAEILSVLFERTSRWLSDHPLPAGMARKGNNHRGGWAGNRNA
ncbi:ESX secretion-associated protein EspG [Amycolatopsis pigmentata]|uniref:ESX secretion-associated protein EspG n=1 Tax=Amycolatopsis pigmentata TaxID=450801 RepID=A0ABW5G166_9PSEU